MRRTDHHDFEEFARARTRELLRTAVGLTGNLADAEDLTQATLAKAYVRWARIRRAENPVAYVRTMQARLFIDQRRLRASSEIPTEDTADVADDGPTRPEETEDLRRALLLLAPLDRAVLIYRFLLDQDVATVAHQLDLSPSAVRTRSSRAAARLREHLGSHTHQTTSST